VDTDNHRPVQIFDDFFLRPKMAVFTQLFALAVKKNSLKSSKIDKNLDLVKFKNIQQILDINIFKHSKHFNKYFLNALTLKLIYKQDSAPGLLDGLFSQIPI
jgi:hypothetical protein